MFDPYDIIGGQSLTLELEFDWTRDDISKDFSIVVWSTNEAVDIEHDREDWREPKLFSAQFPDLREAQVQSSEPTPKGKKAKEFSESDDE